MKIKKKKTILFTKGVAASDKEVQYAIDNGAAIRNAALVPSNGKPEKCDAVLGGDAIPKIYRGLEGVEYPDIDAPEVEKPKKAVKAEKVEEDEEGITFEDADAERKQYTDALDTLGIKYRANATVESLKKLVEEAEFLK